MPKKRNKTPLKPNPVFHIFCEGEKTEPNYFNGYIQKCCPGTRSTKVIRVEPTNKNTAKQLVDEAAKMKKDSPPGDVFWVVYDRESTAKYPDHLHKQAHQKAQKKNINIALSNVCFEIWLILHFQKSVGPFSCFDDLSKRSNLKKHLPDYDKAQTNIFTLLEDLVEKARKNALKMNQNTIKGADPKWTSPYQWNPYTNVYELLNAIDDF